MTSFRLRPRFSYRTSKTSKEVQDALLDQLSLSSRCEGRTVDGHVILYIPKQLRHYWSPQLNINLEDEAHGCTIDGLYSPSPSVWGLFMLAYGALAILFLFLSIIGGSSYMLDEPTWTIYAIPIIVLCAIGLYILSQIGQKIGAEQMFTLHHFLEDAINEKIHNLY